MSNWQKIKAHLDYVLDNSKYYQDLFNDQGIDRDSIIDLESFAQIPTTTKEDFQANNEQFLCVDGHQVVDYVTTSGTLGDALTLALTDADLNRLADNESSAFKVAGITADDIIQITTTLDRRFMAGMAYFLGARKLGAAAVRSGVGAPGFQWDTISRIKPTVLICVPSFLVKLLDYAETSGIKYQDASIKKVICIGEPIRNQDFSLNALGEKITSRWDVQLYSTYASTEMATAFTECQLGIGGHHLSDLIHIECQAENGRSNIGEVIATPLGIEGMPILRYRTGDICEFHHNTCACGRDSLRLGPVIGRKAQMMKLKGTTLFPSSIMNVLNEVDGIGSFQIEVSTNELGLDHVAIKVAGSEIRESVLENLKEKLTASLRVSPDILITDPLELGKLILPEKARKPVLFVDRRE